MRRLIVAFLVTTAIACTSEEGAVSTAQDQDAGTTQTAPVDTSTTVAIPDITPDVAALLRARAFAIGCGYIACENSQIFASERIPAEVRAHIRSLLTREVSYLTDEQATELPRDPYELHPSGGAWIGVDSVEATERADVVSVMTWVYGPGRGMGTQTLFRWNGAEWVNVTAEEVGVPVISAVP